MVILIIDDEAGIRNVMKDILKDEGHQVFLAKDGMEGLNLLDKEKIDICFLDVWMPGIGGIDVLSSIKEKYPQIEVIMISGHAKIDQAVRVTKMGAYDFLEKPLTITKILSIIKNIELLQERKETIKNNSIHELDNMIGKSQQIMEIRKIIEVTATSDARILILGENGTGKELIANEIHCKSSRKKNSFISVNCAAIPENLMESEFFGHEKGAFTGAISERAGKFELANKGTLFLDEIADMPLSLQAKLLRVLQEMKITKVGSSEVIKLDVRVIAATNKDLKEEVKKGNFREDLYYRLNVIPIYVPPLRERKEDIPLIIHYFNQKLSQSNNIHAKFFSEESLSYLTEQRWLGNIRQLRNFVERILVMVEEHEISLEQVLQYIDVDFLKEIYNPDDITEKYGKCRLNEAREKFEKEFIEKKLQENHYNITQTARSLGVFPSNLSTKIAKLGIKPEGKK